MKRAAILICVAAALVVASLFLITGDGTRSMVSMVVEGNSMSPTILSGETVEVAPGRSPRRLDVVMYEWPLSEEVAFIGRVIGLPGDVVEVREGVVWLNGIALEEPYAAEPVDYAMPRFVVPAGDYYILGDNRNDSSDSHVWGTVPSENILGVVEVDSRG